MTQPWYETAFGADYLERYSHRNQVEADRIVQSFLDHTQLPNGSMVFDLCCGAGRHVLSLRQKAMRVVGLDLSIELLQRGLEANRRAVIGQSGFQYALMRGDMRQLPFPESTFDAVTHFFTAFGYFQDDQENFSVFKEVARIMVHGGYYLFDFLSSPIILRDFQFRDEIESFEEFRDGSRVRTIRYLTPDRKRVEKRMQLMREDHLVREMEESVRLFTPRELREALDDVCLSIEEEWGDYYGAPYHPNHSIRWIALCRKR